MDEDVRKAFLTLWDYMQMHHELAEFDLIMVLGNHDLNGIRQGINLFKSGLAPYMLITGGLGLATKDMWTESEADKLGRIAMEQGIPEDRLILENKSTNTGENFIFSRKILEERGVKFARTIIVGKPYKQRRDYAAAKKQWPDVDILISSIPTDFDNYFSNLPDPELDYNIFVGEVQRMDIYAKKGFQIPQEMPPKVWDAMNFLIARGYDKTLAK